MNKRQARQLPDGVYRIFWKDDGGVSVGAIGRNALGDVWVMPSNWISPNPSFSCWKYIDLVQLLSV